MKMDGKHTGTAWQPGQSGNPKGRAKSLKAAVQARVGDDGERIVDEMFKIATDRRLRGHHGARVRLQAWCELRDMAGWKPTATLALEGAGAAGIVFGGRFEDTGILKPPATPVDVEPAPPAVLPAASSERVLETSDASTASPKVVPVVDFPGDAWTVSE